MNEREILFRGKRKDNGEWVYGDLIHRKIWSSELYIIRVEDNGFDSYIEYEVIPKTVGQYTGLTDKNGKKIFEGDIVLDIKGDTHIVTWASKTAMFRCVCIKQAYKSGNNRSCDVMIGAVKTIIGNIYDNPELLEGGAE